MLELLLQRLDDESATSRLLSRPLTYSAIAEWLKLKGDFPDIDVSIVEMMLPNIEQHTVMLRQFARAFKSDELSAEMTLFVAGELNPNHISQRWKLYHRGHLDIHTISTTHADLTSTDSLAEIGPIIARKLHQLALTESAVAIGAPHGNVQE